MAVLKKWMFVSLLLSVCFMAVLGQEAEASGSGSAGEASGAGEAETEAPTGSEGSDSGESGSEASEGSSGGGGGGGGGGDGQSVWVTYNVGLTKHVGGYDERRELTAAAVASLEADVVCLQELFEYEDMVNVLLDPAVAEKFPYFAVYDSEEIAEDYVPTEALCSVATLGSMLPCLTDCGSYIEAALGGDTFEDVAAGVQEVFVCFEEVCPVAWRALEADRECIGCAMHALQNEGAAGLLACANANSERAYISPLFGLALLSKHPLKNSAGVELHWDLIPRGFVYGEVAAEGQEGPVGVICTHLAIGYNETIQEVEELSQFAEESGLEHVVLLGDLNAGYDDEEAGIIAYEPEILEGFEERGWFCPTQDTWEERQCTFCPSVNEFAEGEDDNLIDHLCFFGDGLTEGDVVSISRIMDEKVGDDGNETWVSDHFGVEIVLKLPLGGEADSRRALRSHN